MAVIQYSISENTRRSIPVYSTQRKSKPLGIWETLSCLFASPALFQISYTCRHTSGGCTVDLAGSDKRPADQRSHCWLGLQSTEKNRYANMYS